MKTGFYSIILLLTGALITACGSYKSKQQAAKLTFPELGSLVHTKGELWYANSEQIGKPFWEEPLQVTAQQLPFNKKTYATYASYMANAGSINSVAFVDSMPYKPKYIRLQLLDKIGATTALNSKDNKNVREYLENDASYKLVSRLDISVPDAMMAEILGATMIQLVEDSPLGKHLVLTQGAEENKIGLVDVQIFDYGFSSFCWGEDRYHRKQIEAILGENEKCPKGTFKKASKVTSDKSYLKF